MKIGILTFHYATNYGAVLQAYATQTWLSSQGVDAQIINYVPPLQEGIYEPKEMERQCFADLRKKPIRSIVRWLRFKLLIEKDYKDKRNRFNEFIEHRLNVTSRIKNISEFNIINDDFFAFICGSDQIWNPEITRGFDLVYFCGFSNMQTKKISYAASAGDIEVLRKQDCKKTFFELLKNFDSVAVREESLANFIADESDIQPVVTLDPTLLLESSDYNKIAAQNRYINSDYLLIYQLARNSKTNEVARKIAKERGLEIIEICGTIYTKPHSKRMICNMGPSEFVSLIRDASYIVTNSFHGTALSIIYRKDFNSILSKKRNSRIIDLLNSIELQNRIITDEDDVFHTGQIDYSKPLCILERKRTLSIDYLKRGMVKNKNE